MLENKSVLTQEKQTESLIDLARSFESNSPQLTPSYDILKIYSTWLDKHGIFQRNKLNTHVTQTACRY